MQQAGSPIHMKISADLLEQGRQQYASKLGDEACRVLSDPVITPFVLAMKLGGYREIMVQRCSKLRGCPICPVGKSSYSQQYEKDGQLVWACPHCQNITSA